MEIAAKFRGIAGKCLRLYLNETVSPLEMLLLLDKNFKLKRVFADAHITAPVKQRLKDIYYIRWGLQADFVRGKIVLQRRPLTRTEKLRWLMRSVCMVLCLALIVGTPFIVNVFSPFITDGQGVLNVSRWSQIRFNSDKIYVLQSDVTVPENFFANEMNCELRGNGHTVTVLGNGVFGNLNGKISDVTFDTGGSPIANNVSLSAKVDIVTVNADVNMQIDNALGFFANNNYSQSVTNVVVNVTGTLTAIAAEQLPQGEPNEAKEAASFNCGGIFATNNVNEIGKDSYYAVIDNCTVNYTDFSLQGCLAADAAFGGIVGTNDGLVRNCQANGSISADTFDVAGICAENNYGLVQSENQANITQRSDSADWSPLVAGIVITNNREVYACQNSGAISGEGIHSVDVGGIVARAYGPVFNSFNAGEISAESEQEAHAGGIAGSSCFGVIECVAYGSVEVSAKDCYVGGIVGYAFGWHYDNSPLYCGSAQRCIAACLIKVVKKSSDGLVAVGGIVGLSEEWQVHYTDTDEIVFTCGRIVNCYFIGELQADAAGYVGGIAGVVGKNVYLASESDESPYFYGNMYLEGKAEVAYGRVVTRDNAYENVSSDFGAKFATLRQIIGDATYQDILESFDSIFGQE